MDNINNVPLNSPISNSEITNSGNNGRFFLPLILIGLVLLLAAAGLYLAYRNKHSNKLPDTKKYIGY